MSELDRATAYLSVEHWPDAIPAMGPKRESGPYPWPEKQHADPHDVDQYPAHHVDAMSVGGPYGGDVCPYCGVPMAYGDDAIDADGRTGTVGELDGGDVSKAFWHTECWSERTAEIAGLENTTLDAYAPEGGAD